MLTSQHPWTQEVEVGRLPQGEPGYRRSPVSKPKTWKGGRNVGKQKGKRKTEEMWEK